MDEFAQTPDHDAPPIKPVGMGIFLLVAFGAPLWYLISLISSGIVIDVEALQSDPEAAMAIMVPMMVMGAIQIFSPALGALVARLVGKEGFGEGNFRWMPGKLFWLLFLGLPILVWLAFGITAVSGMGTIDTSSFTGEEMGRSMGGAIGTAILGPLFGMLLAIPASWGWLAYFYSRMVGLFGPRMAAVWSAVPAVLLGVVGARLVAPVGGIGETQTMVAGGLNAVLFTILAAYLYRRWKSIWAAALVSAALNSHLTLPAQIVTNPEPWIGAPSGAIFFLVFGVVAWKVWQADWTPIDESTKLLEPEMAYEIPDTPAIPPPMTAGAPEKPEEAAGDESPGDWA